MSAIASQITSLTIVYSNVYSGEDQRKHQNSPSLAFVRGIRRGIHEWPVTRKMFPFDDVIMMKSKQEILLDGLTYFATNSCGLAACKLQKYITDYTTRSFFFKFSQ